MPQPLMRNILMLSTLTIVSTISAFAQLVTSHEPSTVLRAETWQVAQSAASSSRRLDVVTMDQPRRRQSCRIQSFTMDKLVCSRAVGGLRIFLPQQVIALILPGDHDLKLRLLFGINSGAGAAIWGTIVLAAICPACAAATAVVAVAFLGAAGAVLIGDEQPDRLLYLAPGQQLLGRLRLIQP